MRLCEANAAASAVDFDQDDVPPCDGEAVEERRGYWLCEGCCEALDALADLLPRLKVKP